MSRTSAGVIVLLLGLCTASAAAAGQAQTSNSSTTDYAAELRKCLGLADPANRLACYDEQASKLVQAVDQGELQLVDRERKRKTRRALFGFMEPDAPIFGEKEAEPASREERVTSISSEIQQVRTAGTGRWVLTLADGSQWQTIESNSRFRPDTGDVLEIERAALGSYIGSINRSGFVRIRRVR